MKPRAEDVQQWMHDAHETGKRCGVLDAARWLRMKGKPDIAMALVMHVDEICGAPEPTESPDDLVSVCEDIALGPWRVQ